MNIIFGIIAFIIAFPPVVTYLLFRIVRRPLKNRRRAVHFAAEWTALLYIAAVSFILSDILRHHIGAWMAVLLLIILSFMLIRQLKREGELIFGVVLKRFSRGSFIVFFFLYFLLAVISILLYII